MAASPSSLTPAKPSPDVARSPLRAVPNPASGDQTVRETYAEKTARETRMLAIIAGSSILIVLVFFMVLIVILSHYGPTTP